MDSRWMSTDPKEFTVGDIICNREKQDFLRLVVYKDEIALWCVGMVLCAFSENNNEHPVFPVYFDQIKEYEDLLRLGNLNDYAGFIDNVKKEIIRNIDNIEDYYT